MTDQTDFVANPIAFMNQHVLIPMFPPPWEAGGANAPTASGRLTVCVIPVPNARVLNPPQPGSGVFQFSAETGGLAANTTLDIYWLPYKPDNFRSGMATSADRYLFTAAMNGCTLGIGSQSGDGSCLITHANNRAVGTAQGPAAQAAAQLQQIGGVFAGSAGYSVLTPQGYRQDSGGDLSWSATNFGVSNGANWVFHTHKYLQRNDGGAKSQFFHGGAVTAAVPVPP